MLKQNKKPIKNEKIQAITKDKDGTRAEEPYQSSTQLNGNIDRAPPWPQSQMKNVFILPKMLNTNDTITIEGETFNDRNRLVIGLVNSNSNQAPDDFNVACQLDISFQDDRISIQTIQNGNVDVIKNEDGASGYFPDKSFQITFKVRNEQTLDVLAGSSYMDTVPLKHYMNNIRFLTVYEDVEKVTKLDFIFG